ncbi:hypothetical protein Q0M83_14855, partial [Staphylococcus aureus]|nr:hypothetical protein [Staphylococcus aureus]
IDWKNPYKEGFSSLLFVFGSHVTQNVTSYRVIPSVLKKRKRIQKQSLLYYDEHVARKYSSMPQKRFRK